MDGPVALFKKRSGKSASMRKPPAARRRSPSASASDASSDSGSDGSASGRLVKRRKTGGAGAVLGTSTAEQRGKSSGYEGGATQYAGERSATIEASEDATRRWDWYEDAHETLLGTTRAKKNPTSASTAASKPASLITPNPNRKSTTMGPTKAAPSNVRAITVIDYAPDVCKDYKQTGFCGFGDNCKFLHAREDYAQGWQLDREWELSGKGKKPGGGTTVASANRSGAAGEGDDADDADAALLEKIPFACVICKQAYKQPVVTRCGHYFCEACALKRYRKTPNCAACGSGTGGVFNGAKNLQRLLDRKRERERRRKEKRREEGEDVSGDEEDEGGKKEGEKGS